MIQKCTARKTARTLTHLSARWRTQTRIWTAYAKFTPQLESSIQSRAGGKGICLSPCYDPCYTRSNGREDRRRNIYTLPLRTYLCESIIMCLLRCVVVMLQSVNRVFLNTCGRIFFMKQCCHIRTLTNRMSLLHFFSLFYTSLACTLALSQPNVFRYETARNRESNEYRYAFRR